MYDIWDTIHKYDTKNTEIVIRKLISNPDVRKTIFDLRDESLERLLSSLVSVTVFFQCLDATLLINAIYRFKAMPLVFLSSCEVTCWTRHLNGRLYPALSGALIQGRVT